MISTAIILAAGPGTRLGNSLTDRPKGFMKIGDETLIERSLRLLRANGIDKVLIGTGHLAEMYEALASRYDFVSCVYSDAYATSDSMYTLYQMRDHISSDVLLLESDLLYEDRALTSLQQSTGDVILASEASRAGDEVFIQTDADGYLVDMSKDRSTLSSVAGELVGISRLTSDTLQDMFRFAGERFQDDLNLDYEQTLVAVAASRKLSILVAQNLIWCEIDDACHLKRATQHIYPAICASELADGKSVTRNVLLNPGPATTTDTVKFAQIAPDICPREREFGDTMAYLSRQLTEIVGNDADYTTVLLGGSGTAAVEAMLSSVCYDRSALVIDNGAYGQRMAEILEAYGITCHVFRASSTEPLDYDALEAMMRDKSPDCVAAVHSETTSGLLNDIDVIGKICRKLDRTFLVDAMSSYGAIPIDMAAANIDYLAASSNKNVQGMAGVGFVICSRERLAGLDGQTCRNYYLNLSAQHLYFERTHQMRFTPPVQTIYALRQAVNELAREGVAQRYERYCLSWQTLTEGTRALGLQTIVPDAHHSKIITAIRYPDNDRFDFDDMHQYLRDRGFTIYPGKIRDEPTFRIANIGAINHTDIEALLIELRRYLQSIGYRPAATD